MYIGLSQLETYRGGEEVKKNEKATRTTPIENNSILDTIHEINNSILDTISHLEQ